MKINCSYTFNTDVVHDNLFPTLHMLNGWFSDLINWLLADLFIIFFVSLCICSLNLFHLNIFSSLFSLMYWWMSASSNYISTHPSIHSVRRHAPTYPQFIIYRFCIHKNEFFGSIIGLYSLMHAMHERNKPMRRSPSSSACLHTVINSSLV